MVLKPDIESVVYSDSMLERFEVAMKDQFYFRDNFIISYLSIDNLCTVVSKSIFANSDNFQRQYSYTVIGDYAEIDGTEYLMRIPEVEVVTDATIQIHMNQIEYIHQKYPKIRFYSYYVTQVDETGWFNNYLGTEVSSLYDQVEAILPEYVRSGRLQYDDLEDYKHCHYASDHHWNHIGARRGYEDIYGIMKRDLGLSDVKTPVKEWHFSELYDYRYVGSFARRLGELYSGEDNFSAYEYNLGERKIFAINPETFEEIQLRELGLFNEYAAGEVDTSLDHYIAYYGRGIPESGNEIYGDNNAIYLIKNEEPETSHNLLIYGDSYNRAIRDVLASHFDTTLYFQRDILVNYEDVFIDELIEEYDIDVILYSGNKSIWTTDSYVFDFFADDSIKQMEGNNN
jgi:hypothetical protein